MRLLLIFSLISPISARAAAALQDVSDSSAVQAHVGKGYELIKDERFAEAAAEFQAALSRAPELVRVRYQLGVCYVALGRDREARNEFERLRREAHHAPSVLYFIGRLDLTEHRLDAALGELQAIVAHPPFPDTAYYLGSAYLERGDLAAAEKWLKEAQELNPRDFRVPDHLARVYRREGRSSEAEKQYARSTELRRGYDLAAEAGVACSRSLETGPWEEARSACARLFQPADSDRLTLLGIICGQHGHYAEALDPLQRALRLDPDSYETAHNLGLTFFRLKRYAEAREPLERAVALRPDFFDSNALLGATLFTMGQDQEAYRVLEHAHRLNPQDRDTAELLFRSASILAAKSYHEKRYPEALKYLRTAEETSPKDPQVHAKLGQVYKLMGNTRQAALENEIAAQLAAAR